MIPLKQIVKIAIGETTAKCPICGLKYKYPKGGYAGVYTPKTCANFDCEYKFQHIGLNKVSK